MSYTRVLYCAARARTRVYTVYTRAWGCIINVRFTVERAPRLNGSETLNSLRESRVRRRRHDNRESVNSIRSRGLPSFLSQFPLLGTLSLVTTISVRIKSFGRLYVAFIMWSFISRVWIFTKHFYFRVKISSVFGLFFGKSWPRVIRRQTSLPQVIRKKPDGQWP